MIAGAISDTVALAIVAAAQAVLVALIGLVGTLLKRGQNRLETRQNKIHNDLNGRISDLVETKEEKGRLEGRAEALHEIDKLSKQPSEE